MNYWRVNYPMHSLDKACRHWAWLSIFNYEFKSGCVCVCVCGGGETPLWKGLVCSPENFLKKKIVKNQKIAKDRIKHSSGSHWKLGLRNTLPYYVNISWACPNALLMLFFKENTSETGGRRRKTVLILGKVCFPCPPPLPLYHNVLDLL